MSFWTDVRDTGENLGSVAAAPFTFGQSERFVSRSGQQSGFGRLSQHYSDLWRDADIAGLVAGGAYLGAQALAPQVVGTGTAGAPGAVTPIAAAEAPASTSATLAQGLVQAPAAEVPAAAGVPAVDSSMGMPFTPGPGGAGPLEPGAFDKVTGWIKDNPITSIIGANMIGGALSGVANRSAMLEAEKKRRERELELADLPRKTKMSNTSVGGGNVNLNLKPGSKVLYRPDGTPVFAGTGIVASNMRNMRGFI
jgi:hypothetical protein